MKDTKIIAMSTVFGAVAGAAVSLGIMMSCCKKDNVIAVANVQEIVTASPKVQALQAEQRAKIENLAEFVKKANEEIGKEKSDKIKQELENKYMTELATQKAEFEAVYIKKLTEISNELSAAISEQATNIGYKVVLTKDAVVSGAKDITVELIEAVK